RGPDKSYKRLQECQRRCQSEQQGQRLQECQQRCQQEYQREKGQHQGETN
nr:Chain A, Vicilin [Solanum lycopersicum]